MYQLTLHVRYMFIEKQLYFINNHKHNEFNRFCYMFIMKKYNFCFVKIILAVNIFFLNNFLV